jgi:hypothetical protein
MSPNFQNKLINFIKKRKNYEDLDLSFEKHNEEDYLVLNVDCEKIDKNSEKFDETYYNILFPKKEGGGGLFFTFNFNFFTDVIKEVELYMGIKLKTHFKYKNYDYLNDIENKIESVIKNHYPEIKISFSGGDDTPKLRLGFYNVPSFFMQNNDKDKKKYKDFIQTLSFETGLNLDQYRLSVTMAGLKDFE